MAKLRVAILGASLVGKFFVREFINAGADIIAILGSSEETAAKTAKILFDEFGIYPKVYAELDKLLENECIDAVSICTPPSLHYFQTKKCLEAGLNVLCEKPFVFNSYADNYGATKELAELSEQNGRVLAVNTQWPSILDLIKDNFDISALKSFSMKMQPKSVGVDMLIEQLAHTNSMVVKLIPGGYAERIRFFKHTEKDVEVFFLYANNDLGCEIHFRFIHKMSGPRDLVFCFDGIEFTRKIYEHYRQKLVTTQAIFDLEDPFKISISRFVDAAQGKGSPLVSKREVIENVALQDRIIREYLSAECG